MATLNISLPETLKEFAQDQSKSESYSNPSDYIRSLIRSDKEKKETQQYVEALLLEGIESGDSIPATSEYWDTLKAELSEELK